MLVGAFGNADDSTLIAHSLSSAGAMLTACEYFADDFDATFNEGKSAFNHE